MSKYPLYNTVVINDKIYGLVGYLHTVAIEGDGQRWHYKTEAEAQQALLEWAENPEQKEPKQ